MKLKALCIAMAVTLAGAGIANAAIVNNGDFSQVTPGATTPSGTEASSINPVTGQTNPRWVMVDGWTLASSDPATHGAQGVWYANMGAATNGPGGPVLGNSTGAPLPAPMGNPNLAFVGLNGDQGGGQGKALQGVLSQMLGAGSFVEGTHYVLSFYWAAAQQKGVSGATSDQLHVSLGDHNWVTDTASIGTHGFDGWNKASFGFTATANDAAGAMLSFMNYGLPNGLPPMALLTGVSVDVPEPPEVVIFGGGLLALGFLTVFARRRALRRREQGAELI